MAVSHLYITCNFLKSEHQGELIACIQKFRATCSPPFPLHPEYRSLSSDTSLSHEATAARHKITIFLFFLFLFIYLFILFIFIFFKLLTVEMSPLHGSKSEFWVREQRWSGKKRHKKYFFTQLTVHTTLTEFFTEVLSCNTDAWLITWLARMITRNVVVYMGRSRIWEKKDVSGRNDRALGA